MIFHSLQLDGSINVSSLACLHICSMPSNWFDVFATLINFHSLIYFRFQSHVDSDFVKFKSDGFRFNLWEEKFYTNKIERENSVDGSPGKPEWMRWLYCKISDIKLQKQKCRRAGNFFLVQSNNFAFRRRAETSRE